LISEVEIDVCAGHKTLRKKPIRRVGKKHPGGRWRGEEEDRGEERKLMNREEEKKDAR
jgi:hypothetical protein